MDHRGTRTAAAAYTLVQDALMDLRSTREKIRAALADLPVLGRDALPAADLEEPCPICLVPLESIFAEAEAEAEVQTKVGAVGDGAGAGEGREDGQDDGAGCLGVTKLVGCGHVFCRRDLTEWIQSQHGSCPTCRHVFLHIPPLSHESDDESSDGGEYIPTADDFEDEDEDAFLDIDVDAFTDADADDFLVEAMELDFDEAWEDDGAHAGLAMELGEDANESTLGDAEMTDIGADDDRDCDYDDDDGEPDRGSEWGLTDGESESMTSSEAGDVPAAQAAATHVLDRAVSVSVHEDEDVNAKEGEGIDGSVGATDLAASQQEKGADST